MTVMQIRRTATLGGSPAPLSLLEGQLAVDMAEPNAPRLWVGVPISIDPTGQRVVNAAGGGDFLPLVGGVLTGDLAMTNGAKVWTIGVNDPAAVDTPPGSLIIADTDPGLPHQRFVIEPYAGTGLPPAATRLLANGGVSIGGYELHFVGGSDPALSTINFGAGFLNFGLDNSIPMIVSFVIKGESIFTISEVDNADPSLGGHVSTAEIYLSDHLQLAPSGWVGFGKKTISSPDSVLSPNYHDIAIHPYLNPSAVSPESTAILIHCDDGAGPLVYQTSYQANQHNFASRDGLTPYGYWDELGVTLVVDPTLPMHAVTKQYADAITAGGGNFLPLSGGELIGPLAMTSAPQTWTLGVTDAAAVAPAIPGAFSITDTTTAKERLLIEKSSTSPLLPVHPVVISRYGDISLRNQLTFTNDPAPDPVFGNPYLWTHPGGFLFCGGGASPHFVMMSLDGTYQLFNFAVGNSLIQTDKLVVGSASSTEALHITLGPTNTGLLVSKSVKTTNLLINDTVNYEYALGGDWDNNIARYGTMKGGTGVAHDAAFLHGGVEKARLTTNGFVLNADPTVALGAATKQYVDAQASGGVMMSDTAPVAPTNGMLWFDSANVRLNIWYDDGTSAQWLSV